MCAFKKDHRLLMANLFFIACLLIAGCAFKGKPLNTIGVNYEPHVVWNGAHFGIVYYHSVTPSASPQINLIKVDKKGTTLAANTGIGSITHLYVPFRLSDLVWNSDNKQFAFAYTKGKVIHFIRLDADLKMIGSPLEIKFHVLVDSMEHPTLVDLSLVWNHVKKEYALSYITEEHPYLQERHDDLYISRISPSGGYVGPHERYHMVSCPGDCEKTSLAYNTSTGQYAFSYIKNDYPKHDVMIGLFSPGGGVTEHQLMANWNPGIGGATRIVYDPRSNEYLVVALKRKPGSSNGHEISYQIVKSNGTAQGAHYVLAGTQGFDQIVSISNYLSPIKNRYLISASQQAQIRCWIATETGFFGNDFAATSSSVNSWHPSLAVVDAIYLTWIQDGSLYFGVAKKK